MRKFLFLLLAVPAFAQPSNPSIISVTVAPSGSCSAGLPNQQVISTGVQYSCQNGTWGAINGGSSGSGTVNIGTTGQVAYYPGNGAEVSGNTLVTTDSNGLITKGTPVLDVRAYGCALDGTTDDTTCLQNAVTACFTRSGSLYIPSVSGKLHLAGAINAACDALICAPSVLSSAVSQQCEIFGNIENNWVGSGGVNSSGVIQTAISAGTDANSAIIGVPAVGGNFGSFDNVILKVHDLTMLTYANPSIGGVNCASAGECYVYNFTYTNGESYSGSRTQPTNDRTAVILPLVNNWNKAVLHDSTIFGIYTGFKISEHADIEDVNVQSGIQGVVTTAGFHNAHLKNVTFAEVVTPVVATGGRLPIQFDNLDLEIDSTHHFCSWCSSGVDISDASNFLNGNITYASVTANTGAYLTLAVTGGANIFYSKLSGGGAYGGPIYTLPPLGQTVLEPSNAQFKISGSTSSYSTPFYLSDNTLACNTNCSGPAETSSGMTAGGTYGHFMGVTLASNFNSMYYGFHYTGAGSTSNYFSLGFYGLNDVIKGLGTGEVDFLGAIKGPAARKGTFVCTGGGTITISNTNETATSDVIISMNAQGGTITIPPAMKTVTGATGFTVLCGATDTSTYNYTILN